MTAGGTSSTSYGSLQTYYGTSIVGGALRLQPSGGSVLINRTTDSGAALQVTGGIEQSSVTSSMLKADSSGLIVAAVAGTDYVAPSALSGYVPTSRTLSINGVSYDLSADRSWTITAGISSVSGTAPISVSTISGAATVSISQATTSTDGYLSSSDWTTFNNKVPPSRTLTINGTTYDLSANRSWTITPNINATTTQDYTATAGQVTFTVTGGYTVGQLAVFYNGSKLATNEFTATDGSTFTLATACQVNDIVQAVASVTGGGIGGSGATGQVAYWNGSGTQTGTNNFYWDNTNVQLGVGTNAPSAGVTSYSTVPATQFKAAGVAPAFTFSNTLLSPTLGCVFGLATGSGQFVTGTAAGDMAIANQSATAGAIVFGTGTTERMRMTSAGTLSIGNTNTTYKLDVSGTIRATGTILAGAANGNIRLTGATTDGFIGVNTSTMYLTDWDTAAKGMVINLSTGSVGIGTTSPANLLDVVKAGTNAIRVQNTANTTDAYYIAQNTGGSAFFGINATGPYIYTASALAFTLITNNVERMRITSGGNVLIGTTSSSGDKFQVSGGAYVTQYLAFGIGSASKYIGEGNQISGAFQSYDLAIANYATSGRVPIITSTGTGVYLGNGATSWATWSDERLKNINSNIENALDKLSNIRAVNYSWKSDDTNKEYLGLIAQDIETVFPQVIDKSKSFKEGDDTEYLSVRYTELIPVLLKAIQELEARLKTLENK